MENNEFNQTNEETQTSEEIQAVETVSTVEPVQTSSVIETPKKKSALPILILIFVLAVVGVGGYFIAQKFIGSKTPKEMFMSSIEKAVKKNSNIKERGFNTLSDKFNINVKVSSVLLDQELLNVINKLNISGKVDYDTKNNIFYANIDTTYDKESLLKLSTYLEDNTMYMMFGDLLNKWIKVDGVDTSSFDFSNIASANTADLEKYSAFFDEMLKEFKGALKDDYFTSEKIDGGTRITLTIDDNNVKDILIDTIKGLKESKDFKKVYKDVYGVELVDSELEASINNLKNENLSVGKIVVKLDTNSKGEFTKIDVTIGSGSNEYSLVFEQTSDDTVEFAVKTQGIKMFSGSYTAKENNGKSTVKLTLSMMEMINVELNIEEEITYDGKIEKVDVSNAVSSDQLTDADVAKLDKIYDTKGMKKLLKDLEKIDLTDLTESFGGSSSFSF